MSQSPPMVKDSISGADYFLRGFSLIRQPGIRTFVDGRRVSTAEAWPGVTYRVIGIPGA